MSFKKIELAGLHPANPLHHVINDVNYNTDALISALDGLSSGSGVVGPVGPKGDTGAQGPAGQNGTNGLSLVYETLTAPTGSCGSNPDGSLVGGTVIIMAQIGRAHV